MIEMIPIFFLLMSTQHPEYKNSFETCTDAVYRSSDLRKYVDLGMDKMNKEYPQMIKFGALGYALGVRKEAEFKTSKIVPLDNSQTVFKGNKSEGKIEFRFGI